MKCYCVARGNIQLEIAIAKFVLSSVPCTSNLILIETVPYLTWFSCTIMLNNIISSVLYTVLYLYQVYQLLNVERVECKDKCGIENGNNVIKEK